MNIRKSISSATTAFGVAAILSASLGAQQPPPTPPNPPDPKPQPQLRVDQPDKMKETSIVGELTRVDTAAKTLTITTREGKTDVIRYDEDTKVTGSQTGVAGLANQTKTNVTVTVEGVGPARMATEIKVEKAQP